MTTLLARPLAPETVAPARTITIGMGEAAVSSGADRLETLGLGSCVAVIVFAPRQRLAAMAHCMLPVREELDGVPMKFVESAVPALLDLLASAGGAAPFSAALVGGACMFPGVPATLMRDIAGRNVSVARAALTDAAIPVRLEDVGGHEGRSVVVMPSTQQVMVRTIRGGARWL